MTREQAEEVAKFIDARLSDTKMWSVHVSETRKPTPDAPTKYRVVLNPLGSDRPLAIYSARILLKPVAKDAIL